MAHRRLYSLAHVAIGISIISSALFSVAATASRAVDAFVGLALSLFDQRPARFDIATAFAFPRVLGLAETRSFQGRMIERPATMIGARLLT